jgi:hypothetical protein
MSMYVWAFAFICRRKTTKWCTARGIHEGREDGYETVPLQPHSDSAEAVGGSYYVPPSYPGVLGILLDYMRGVNTKERGGIYARL